MTLHYVSPFIYVSHLTHKYTDNTTMTEILSAGQTSQMAGYMNKLYQW